MSVDLDGLTAAVAPETDSNADDLDAAVLDLNGGVALISTFGSINRSYCICSRAEPGEGASPFCWNRIFSQTAVPSSARPVIV